MAKLGYETLLEVAVTEHRITLLLAQHNFAVASARFANRCSAKHYVDMTKEAVALQEATDAFDQAALTLREHRLDSASDPYVQVGVHDENDDASDPDGA